MRPLRFLPRFTFTFISAVALALAVAHAAQPATPPRPNLIVIMADDIGASELSGYGHTTHRTPNLDQLGQTGVQFDTCYTAPVCHPTRFTLMTGQYGFRTGVVNFSGKRGGPPKKHQGPDNITTHLTFAQPLKAAGYATAVAGKWQLSGEHPTLARETGFDEYCLWGYREHYSAADREKALAAGIDFRSRYWHPSIVRNAQWVPTGPDDYGPDIFTDFLVDFVRRHRDQPFFLYYPIPLTHGPLLPTPDSYKPGMSHTTSNKANFRANVEYMDKLIGRLLRALDETGVRSNTIIMFTGDNGTGGDGKSTATEKGARVPLIVNGPGFVKPRGITAALADTSDVFPTLMELGGAKLPAGHVLDGRSFAPFLRGERETTREWIFAYQADRRILRTERWLLEDNSPRHPGRLFDCGTSRNGTGYKDVTASTAPEAVAARKFFDDLLKTLPAPLLDHDGAPNEKNNPDKKKERRKKK